MQTDAVNMKLLAGLFTYGLSAAGNLQASKNMTYEELSELISWSKRVHANPN